jgi:threonine 3-dehydrogenase
LAQTLGATRTVDVSREKLEDVQRELGMAEGFDVGLEMSGNPSAFKDLLANMCHGGKVSILGIPSEEMAIDWNQVIFNMLTLKGIYGREMYETWYKMSVMIESGLNIAPVITHRLDYRDFQQGFDAMNTGSASKVILNWE